MKSLILCVTVLCIANVNGTLRSLDSFYDAASDRSSRAEGEFRKDLAGHSTRSTMEERNDQNHLSAEMEYMAKWVNDEWGKEARKIIDFINSNPGQLQSEVNSMPDSPFANIWNTCKEITSDLSGCFKIIFGGETETQNKLYDFVSKNNGYFDNDDSGSLNYKEFKFLFAILAAIDTGFIFENFDADKDRILNSDEAKNYRQSCGECVNFNYVSDNQVNEAYHSNTDEHGWMPQINMVNFFVQVWGISANNAGMSY